MIPGVYFGQIGQEAVSEVTFELRLMSWRDPGTRQLQAAGGAAEDWPEPVTSLASEVDTAEPGRARLCGPCPHGEELFSF